MNQLTKKHHNLISRQNRIFCVNDTRTRPIVDSTLHCMHREIMHCFNSQTCAKMKQSSNDGSTTGGDYQLHLNGPA